MNVAGEKYGNCTVLETDAEDSSYDSDFEGEDSVGSTSFHSQGDLQVCNSEHPNASRTASDTLAAEFAEYVTVQGNPTTQSPGYMARVEFALKLGYTEQLVQTALEKLGPDPEQNELLAELIKLGASCSQKLLDTVEDPNNVFDADFGSNKDSGQSSKLRPIVIDGSNVAMSHGNKEVFSCRGIKICVDWFRSRGHKEITVFVPKWRKEASRIDNPIADQEILGELERDRLLVFTPSRLIGGKRMICYDDRYILKLAAEIDGVVVSNDNYRDLAQENSEFRRVIEKRILMYTFVNDRFMPPDDPLGRTGPTLDNFLKASPTKSDPVTPCPYAKKCTYGNKCKFRHPERDLHPQKSVTEKLEEHVQKHLNVKGSNNNLLSSSTPSSKHKPLCKTRSMIPSGNEQSLSSIMESKSAENIGTDQSANPLRQGTPQLPATSCSQGFRSSHRSAGRTGKPEAEQNLHKKLQRQLTLNPSSMASPDLKHKPLTRHCSNELPHKTSMSCDRSEPGQQHHHVTRMASAPESFQSWTQNNPNVDLPPSSSTQQQVVTDAQMIRNSLHSGLYDNFYPDMLREFLDLRTEAYNFLVDLFPEGLVRLVMLIHPFELDEITLLFAIRKILRRQQLQQ